MALPDLLPPRMRIVFCGTAAGRRSAATGTYYAGRGNKFWQVLADVGLTPRKLEPHEYTLLPAFGVGLTDLAKRHAGPDSSIPVGAYDVEGFARRITAAAPAVVAFNGKKAASAFLGRSTRDVTLGLQHERIGTSSIFVLPSTSGAANGHWKPEYWTEVAWLVGI